MMQKRVLSVFLALLLALGCLPFNVFSKGERVYTVTLKPGDAWGEDVVFRSNETGIAANYRSAKNGQFYYEDDGGLGFHYDFYKYPESWIAPERAVFVGFLEGNGNDAVNYYPLTYTNTVFIA